MGIFNIFGNKKENKKDIVEKISCGEASYEAENRKDIVNLYKSFLSYKTGRLHDRVVIDEAAADTISKNALYDDLYETKSGLHEFYKTALNSYELTSSRDAVVKTCTVNAYFVQSAVIHLQCIRGLDERFGGGYSVAKLVDKAYDPEVLSRALTEGDHTYRGVFGEKGISIPDKSEFKAFVQMVEKVEEAMRRQKPTANDDGMLIDCYGNLIEEDLLKVYDEKVKLNREVIEKLKAMPVRWYYERLEDKEISTDEFKAHYIALFIRYAHLYFEEGRDNLAVRKELVASGYAQCYSPVKSYAVKEGYSLLQFKTECLEAASDDERQIVSDYADLTIDIADDFLGAKKRFDLDGKFTLFDGRVFE